MRTVLEPEDVKWIIDDHGDLGVMINGQAFFLYKGHSLEYAPFNDDGSRAKYRPVRKREFGESCNSEVNWDDEDPKDWTDLPYNIHVVDKQEDLI